MNQNLMFKTFVVHSLWVLLSYSWSAPKYCLYLVAHVWYWSSEFTSNLPVLSHNWVQLSSWLSDRGPWKCNVRLLLADEMSAGGATTFFWAKETVENADPISFWTRSRFKRSSLSILPCQDWYPQHTFLFIHLYPSLSIFILFHVWPSQNQRFLSSPCGCRGWDGGAPWVPILIVLLSFHPGCPGFLPGTSKLDDKTSCSFLFHLLLDHLDLFFHQPKIILFHPLWGKIEFLLSTSLYLHVRFLRARQVMPVISPCQRSKIRVGTVLAMPGLFGSPKMARKELRNWAEQSCKHSLQLAIPILVTFFVYVNMSQMSGGAGNPKTLQKSLQRTSESWAFFAGKERAGDWSVCRGLSQRRDSVPLPVEKSFSTDRFFPCKAFSLSKFSSIMGHTVLLNHLGQKAIKQSKYIKIHVWHMYDICMTYVWHMCIAMHYIPIIPQLSHLDLDPGRRVVEAQRSRPLTRPPSALHRGSCPDCGRPPSGSLPTSSDRSDRPPGGKIDSDRCRIS